MKLFVPGRKIMPNGKISGTRCKAGEGESGCVVEKDKAVLEGRFGGKK